MMLMLLRTELAGVDYILGIITNEDLQYVCIYIHICIHEDL